jgi:sulfur carrier protein
MSFCGFGRAERARIIVRSIVVVAVLSIVLNGSPHRCDDSLTVADLVRQLALQGKRVAVERNGEIVPKSRHGETRLATGDRIEIVAAVGGG